MRTDSNWIATVSGRQFWPLDPLPEDICIGDIAHSLAMKCRFTGQCRDFYSVAQHSVMVSRLVPREHALWGLLHDASEAYLPDVARPIKSELPGFLEIEELVMLCVANRFKLRWPIPDSVHIADRVMLATERRDLMTPIVIRPWRVIEGIEPLPQTIVAWGPSFARQEFLHRFEELWPMGKSDGGVEVQKEMVPL